MTGSVAAGRMQSSGAAASKAVALFVAKAETFEGYVDHLYLCSRSHVTTGYGKVLPTSVAAQAVAFLFKAGPAAPEVVAEDWQRIRDLGPVGQPNNYAAAWYAKHCRIRLAPGEGRRLLTEHVEGNEAALRRIFPAWHGYPLEAQVGLIDMVYNLGEGGLVRRFPRFCAAVRAQDWAQAAEQCQRQGIQAARNAWARKQFETAARAVAA